MDQFYHCSLCRQTLDEYDLTVHLLMHLEGKLGYCNECVKGFQTAKELTKHLLKHLKNILHVVNGADPDAVITNKRKGTDGTVGKRKQHKDVPHANGDVRTMSNCGKESLVSSPAAKFASSISRNHQHQTFTASKTATDQPVINVLDRDAVRANRYKVTDETGGSRKLHRDKFHAKTNVEDSGKESLVSSTPKYASPISKTRQLHPHEKRSRTEPRTVERRKLPQDETHAKNNVSHSTNSANAVSKDTILSKDIRSSNVSRKFNSDKFQTNKDVAGEGNASSVPVSSNSASTLLKTYQDQNHKINSIQPPGGIPRCNICNRLFHTPHLLKQHMATHKDQHRCNFCGLDFSSDEDRKKHMKPECKICGDVFICEGLLANHTASRSCEIQYTCEVCNESFTQKKALMNHKQCHNAIAAFVGINKNKPWTCGKCSLIFATSEALAEHLKTHFVDNSDPDAASRNGVKTSDEAGLSKKQHGHYNSLAYFLGNNQSNPWKCGKCYQNFETSEILAEHLKNHFVNASGVDAEGRDSDEAVDETGLNPKSHEDANHAKTDVEVIKMLDDFQKGALILRSTNFASSVPRSKPHRSVTICKAGTKQSKTRVIKLSAKDPVRGRKRKAVDVAGGSWKPHREKSQTDRNAKGVKSLGDYASQTSRVVDDELETDDQESTGTIIRLKNRCVFCDETFSNEEYKQEHGEAECDICGDTFVCKTSLLAHTVAHASKKRQKKNEKTGGNPVSSETETEIDIKCHRCELKFDTYKELRFHTQGHEHLTYFCNYCGKSFFREFDEHEHCNAKCKICKTKFDCKSQYVAHEGLKICHKLLAQRQILLKEREIQLKEQERQQREQLTCKTCRNIFASKQILRKHAHHCPKYYKQITRCTICKSQFPTADKLGEHMKTCITPCENCKSHFSTESALKEHSKTCVSLCKDCGSTFQTVAELQLHSSTCIRTCKNCSSTFPTMSELREHSRTCAHPCQYCGVKLQSESEKQNHRSDNCAICGTWFICSGYLATHYTESHNGESPPLRKVQQKTLTFRQVQEERHELITYSCNHCKKTFFRGIEKREHSNAKCKFCKTIFDCKSQCTAHEAAHEECHKVLAQKEMLLKKEQERYQREHLTCKNCRNTFASKQILEVHYGHCSEGMEQTYKCAICKSQFPTVSELGEHMKTCIPPESHNGESSALKKVQEKSPTSRQVQEKRHESQTYFCIYCGKTFFQGSEVRKHCNAECKFCKTEFNCKSRCLAHEALHEKSQELPAQREMLSKKEQESYQQEHLTCKNCQKIFASEQILSKHFHHCPKDYKQVVMCTMCKSQFPTVSELGEHMKTCIPPCEFCKSHFSTWSELREHSKTCFRSCKYCRSTFPTVSELRAHSKTCVPLVSTVGSK